MNLADGLRSVEKKENQVVEDLESLLSQILKKEKQEGKNRFDKLRGVHKLQKSIVRQNMHNAMSPISAISGYLELINLSLSHEPDVKQIEHYRKQIEAGIGQVNKILEQLMEIYSDESDSISEESEVLLDVDLNWVVQEVCKQMHCSGPNIGFNFSAQPLYVRTDLFMTKLIIFNLISYVAKCSSGKDSIELKTSKSNNMAVFSLEFEASEKKVNELTEIMSMEMNEGSKGINSFNEGILKSRTLVQQIDGFLDFQSEKDEKPTISLHIPFSCSEN